MPQQSPKTGLVLGLAMGGLAAVGGAAYAIAGWSSRRGFAGLGDAFTIKMFSPDGKLVGREEVSLSKRDVVDVAKIKLHPTSPRVEIWKGHTIFSSTLTRWRTFKLPGSGGRLGAFGVVDWLATSQYRYRASASERRLYGGRAVTEFLVYRREDRDDPKKWYKVRGYGPTPGERKTFAIRRAQEMAAQGVPPQGLL